MPPLYVEPRYCEKCMTTHFVEVWRASSGEWMQKCHGEDLALETEKTFAKRSGRGYKIYQLRGIKELRKPLPTSILQDEEHIRQLIDF